MPVRRARRAWSTTSSALGLVGIGLALWPHSAAAAVFRTGQPVMGTVLQVTVIAGDAAAARAAADAAIDEARRWDDILTTWRPSGELAQLAAHAGGGATTISPDLAAALRVMQRLSAATDGAFDPAVGPLVDLWRGPASPSSAQLARVTPARLATVLTLDVQQATLAPGAKIDAGGIGKGLALDAIGALLRGRGVQAAFLDFGGSSQLALGAPPESPDGWRVAVSGLAPDRVHGVLPLRDAALSTSRASGGPSPAGPIIDPRNGRPVPAPQLATVRAADASSAEAWSKAVIVLGHAGVGRAAANGVDVLFENTDGVERTARFTLEPFDPAAP